MENFRKIVKPPDRLRKKKRERREIANIRNERKNITVDSTDLKRKRGYFKHLCLYISNLDDMNKFHEKFCLNFHFEEYKQISCLFEEGSRKN